MADPTVASLLTVIGLGPIVAIVLQAIFAALKVTDEQRDRFGPLSAIGVGVVLGTTASFVLGIATPETVYVAILTGIAAGPSGSWVHDAAKSAGLKV